MALQFSHLILYLFNNAGSFLSTSSIVQNFPTSIIEASNLVLLHCIRKPSATLVSNCTRRQRRYPRLRLHQHTNNTTKSIVSYTQTISAIATH